MKRSGTCKQFAQVAAIMEEQKNEGVEDKVQGDGFEGEGDVWLAHTKDEAHRCAHNGISPLL